ncbi:MAG: enoyl-CoA hydratase/isomerase family protein [Pseudomonadota bacterium]|nr:MAG: enoyl-CoA hydratase/isomerase family protein [Pseudomonadota bacterium]
MKHLRQEHRDDIAILTLDAAGQSANVLSTEMLDELEQTLTTLAGQSLKGLVIRSGKSSGFVAGADVREFITITDPARATELARHGQQVFGRIAALPFPTVAVIHGYCLGGGLELALSCRYRIARDDASTRLGLPEVRLGINPGFGGTVRLPPLIGHLAALDMMLSGRALAAKQAKRVGLVDDAVPERHLERAAYAILRSDPGRRRPAWYRRLPGWMPLRPTVVKLLTRKVREKANAHHYPAPYRILELWQQDAGFEQEARSLGELLVSRTSHNLVHVFLLGESLKKRGKEGTHDIKRVHVVGAGVMGADIAMWAAHRGFEVSLQDRTPEILGRAMKRAHEFFQKQYRRDARAVQAAMDRLLPDVRGDGLKRADLVIEAIIEKAEPKQALFRDIEAKVPARALLATNTSSIPLETLSTALKDPTRLVGLHFFNPVAKMQLVEIVRGEQSSETALARARAFTTAIDRLPLDVKSSPGFLVNRILMPYLLEAVRLYEEGVPGPAIDQAARDFGMPMGPIELADTVGLDICLSVAQELAGPLGVEVPGVLRRTVDTGKLGRKSGEGFYRYDTKGHAQIPKTDATTSVPVTERLVLRLLNEAMACLREGVVQDADAVDAGMVYGTGFAPFLGGPMRYAESLGETGITHSLSRLAEEYGKRFKPDGGWSQPGLLQRRNSPG